MQKKRTQNTLVFIVSVPSLSFFVLWEKEHSLEQSGPRESGSSCDNSKCFMTAPVLSERTKAILFCRLCRGRSGGV